MTKKQKEQLFRRVVTRMHDFSYNTAYIKGENLSNAINQYIKDCDSHHLAYATIYDSNEDEVWRYSADYGILLDKLSEYGVEERDYDRRKFL